MKDVKTPKNIKVVDLDNLLLEEDSFVEVKNIKKGDFVYECDENLGINYEFQALYDAQPHNNGWRCFLKNNHGEEFEVYVSGFTQPIYLPKLYRTPQFIDDSGEDFYYPIV